MGYFFSFLSIIITIYWIYRGIRRGLYPALNIFMVFFLPLLITLNYYDLLFNLVGRIAPETTPTTRETISFVGTYFLSFTLLLYFCLWLCVDVMRIHKLVDNIGGGIVGACTGVVCCGVLMLMWFSMPFARLQFPINDTEMFYPAHRLTLRAATYVAHRISGGRQFSGERFFRDLRYGLPSIPSLGEGFYVASVPNGARVFVEGGGGDPKSFLDNIKKRLDNPDEEVKPSEQRSNFGERNRTPIFIGTGSGGGGNEALIAMVLDEVPRELADLSADKMFVHDGEVYYSREVVGDRVMFIKIYRVVKQGNIGTVVGLFQPQDDKLPTVMQNLMLCLMQGKDPDRLPDELKDAGLYRNEADARDAVDRARMMVEFLPSSAHFRFDDATRSRLMTDLMANGATNHEAEGMIPWLQYGGKVWFIGRGKKPYIAEITGESKYRIEEVKAPEIVKDERAGAPRR